MSRASDDEGGDDAFMVGIEMAHTAANREHIGRGSVRPGRPRRASAGEVEERILEAAAKVFLDRGYNGASIDEIALEARAGKPTIYARYSGKEALFSAVVAQRIRQNSSFETPPARGLSSEDRLKAVATALLERALASEAIGLVRVAVAESRRFPDLASNVGRMARERGDETVAKLLGELARSDEMAALRAFAPGNLAATARRFTEMVVLPIVMRALFGESPERLRAEIDPHVAESVAFFLAACRASGSGPGARRASPAAPAGP
jgi:AcrR family transcriptional regulator